MIVVEGLDRLEEWFTSSPRRLERQADDALADVAAEMVEAAKGFAPKRSGQLAASITAAHVGRLEYEVGPEKALGGFYGHIVERGLAGNPPQPFMDPAADRIERKLGRLFARTVDRVLS